MWSRRDILRTAAFAPIHLPAVAAADHTGFHPHSIRKGDGQGGWKLQSAELQFLHGSGGAGIKPFALAQMDNGELILAASWDDGSNAKSAADREKPVMCFSRDGGRTWSPFAVVANAKGRPVMFTAAGKGALFFQTDLTAQIHQFFSSDYGRSWRDAGVLQRPALDGAFGGIDGYFGGEGNALVERRPAGTRIFVIGFTYRKGTSFPADPAVGMLRWSDDGGHTWSKEVTPVAWLWQDSYQDKTYTRGISEGSLVRAANGWMVAALRSDMPYRFVNMHNDNMEGIAVSISEDHGATWSPLNVLYQGGRMHANLLRMPDGLLVMTYIVRQDYDGCAAPATGVAVKRWSAAITAAPGTRPKDTFSMSLSIPTGRPSASLAAICPPRWPATVTS